jgi:hypothetical protein
MISFNIISSPEHRIVLRLHWFEVHNPSIDWRTREIGGRNLINVQAHILEPKPQPHKISTISLKELSREGQEEEMFLFAVMINPGSNSESTSPKKLPKKYEEFSDVFDKKKASTVLDHRLYDCPIDLQLGQEPPWGPI